MGSHGEPLTPGVAGGQEGRGSQLVLGKMAKLAVFFSGFEEAMKCSKGFAVRAALSWNADIHQLCGLGKGGSLL